MLKIINFIMIILIYITTKKTHENLDSEGCNGKARPRENKEHTANIACNASWAIHFKTLEELLWQTSYTKWQDVLLIVFLCGSVVFFFFFLKRHTLVARDSSVKLQLPTLNLLSLMRANARSVLPLAPSIKVLGRIAS